MKRLAAILLAICISTGGIPFATQQAPANIPRSPVVLLTPLIKTSLDKVAEGEAEVDPNAILLPLPTEKMITGTDISLASEWPAPKKTVSKSSKTRKKR
jgi:hypothetical protein